VFEQPLEQSLDGSALIAMGVLIQEMIRQDLRSQMGI
jgi:hypothetical protein